MKVQIFRIVLHQTNDFSDIVQGLLERYKSEKWKSSYLLLELYKVLHNTLCQMSRTGDPTFQTSCLSDVKNVINMIINH